MHQLSHSSAVYESSYLGETIVRVRCAAWCKVQIIRVYVGVGIVGNILDLVKWQPGVHRGMHLHM
jgi:hypothetical protein